MSGPDLHPEELIERLSSLGADERARLDAHLAVCHSCRFEVAARADFAALPDTSAQVEDLVTRTLAGLSTPAPLSEPRRIPSWMAVAAVLLLGFGSFAAIRRYAAPLAALIGVRLPPRHLGAAAAGPALAEDPSPSSDDPVAPPAAVPASVEPVTGRSIRTEESVGAPTVSAGPGEALTEKATEQPRQPTSAAASVLKRPTAPAMPATPSKNPVVFAPLAETAPAEIPAAPKRAPASGDGSAMTAAPSKNAIAAVEAVQPETPKLPMRADSTNGPQMVAAPRHAAVTEAAPLETPEIPTRPTASASFKAPAVRPAFQKSQHTADSALAEATTARVAGKRDDAERLYRELTTTFPSTPEARVAHATLGRLMLETGRTNEAVEQFDAALGGSAFSLREDTLARRAGALEGLDRTRAVVAWRELLAEYPNSLWSKHARSRLERLESP